MKNKNAIKRKSGAMVAAIMFMLAMIPFTGISQEQNPTVYAVVEYMKVKQGDDQKYVDIEQNYWKKIHQERVNQGEIVRWMLYEVRFAGSNDEYNYVTATIVDDPAKLETPFANIDFEKIFPGEDIDKISNETMSSRQLVKRNLIQMVSSLDPDSGPEPFGYIEVDFMKVKPGNGGAYVDVENNVWKPVHKEFIKEGSRVGWALWQTIFPSGSGLDFQYATVNYIKDFSKINAADYNGAFAKAHANEDVDKLMEDTNNSRDLVRSELWRVVDAVGR